uniref:Uncharacterized protein n=1 Tax=Acyrthosiphon pisum TaxID=7029 RepID=C4WXK7_ACYPI|nr:hypothetical protein [Acyrthosiphon pisum]
MIFFKQYLIILTFIVIAVLVMPVTPEETDRQYLSVFCTALYEAGRLSSRYNELSIKNVNDLKISIYNRIDASAILLEQGDQVEKKGDQVEKKDEFTLSWGKYEAIRNSRIKALSGKFVEASNLRIKEEANFNVGESARKRQEKNKAMTMMESFLRDILVFISGRVDALKSYREIENMDQINEVLKNLTIEFTNFLKESVKGNKFCPLPDDFCIAKTALTDYKAFYQSILKFSQPIQFT